jgi:phenylalanyl-tRNA synthetase alpha subunit
VYLRENNDVAHKQMSGRVEHVVSGQNVHFVSLEELLDFIARVLALVRGPPRRKVKN